MAHNSIRRILLSFVLACTLAWGMGGCGSAAVNEPASSGATVTDSANRQVVLPAEVDEVACLYAYTGHVCVLLGCEDRIVAVVNGLKRDHLMERKVENLSQLPVPYNKGSINIEELAAIRPDVTFVRQDILQDAGELEKLDTLGATYVVVDYTTMEDQIASIEMMGESLGCSDRALAYTNYYRSTIDLVKERVSAIPAGDRKTVYHSVNEVVRTDIPQTLSFEILEAAGAINVVQSAGELQLDGDKGMATVEQIYVWDPDIVLTNEPAAFDYFNNDAKFRGLRAVEEGNVFQLPVGISRWGHPGSLESPIAALYIAKLLYPQAFSDIDINQEIKDFYQKYFDITLSDEDVASIISGQGMREAREGGRQA